MSQLIPLCCYQCGRPIAITSIIQKLEAGLPVTQALNAQALNLCCRARFVKYFSHHEQ